MKTLAALALLGTALLLSACGSGGGASTSSPGATPSTQSAPASGQPSPAPAKSPEGQGTGAKPKQAGAAAKETSASFNPPAHHDSGGGTTQFEIKGGDNSIQESGSEASGSEFDQAAAALHGYLDARAAGARSAACSYMVPGLTASMAQLGGAAGGEPKPSCPQLLAALSASLPPAALREAAIADVGVLRIEGERAFLLFHGAHHIDYFMPMAHEGGEWKVAALAASALP